jgi:hypothetical protein
MLPWPTRLSEAEDPQQRRRSCGGRRYVVVILRWRDGGLGKRKRRQANKNCSIYTNSSTDPPTFEVVPLLIQVKSVPHSKPLVSQIPRHFPLSRSEANLSRFEL